MSCRTRRHKSAHCQPGPIPLLVAILTGVPRLPEAACRRQPHLFDADCADLVEAENREREALRLCRACPELEACQRWVDSLPPRQRPCGVVAGKVIRKRAKTPA